MRIETRWEQLSEDLYAAVFAMLDAEPECSGMETGRIATELQRAFLREMNPRTCDYCGEKPATGYVAAYRAHVCEPCYVDHHGPVADQRRQNETVPFLGATRRGPVTPEPLCERNPT